MSNLLYEKGILNEQFRLIEAHKKRELTLYKYIYTLIFVLNTYKVKYSYLWDLRTGIQLDVPVMKGRTWYSLKKDLRPFITGTLNC